MAFRHPLQRLLAAAMVMTLPLLLSQCAKKPKPPVQGLSLEQQDKLQSTQDAWMQQKPRIP